jgi:hypothetical protein
MREVHAAPPVAHRAVAALSTIAATVAEVLGSLWPAASTGSASLPRPSDQGADRFIDTGPRRFSLVGYAAGGWTLNCADTAKSVEFDDLASALAFARAEAEEKSADIELLVDGLYIFIHQPEGWPHAVCAPPRSPLH